MYLLSLILLVFFAIIGLCGFINAIICAAHNSTGDEILIIINHPNESHAEAQIRKAARLCLNTKGTRLICVCDESSPSMDICRIMTRDYPFIEIKSTEEAQKLFSNSL